MISFPRVTVIAAVAGLLLAACGQKGPLVMLKDELPKAPAKVAEKPKAKPKQAPQPQATPEPEEPSPDVDDVQDGYAPMSDQPDF